MILECEEQRKLGVSECYKHGPGHFTDPREGDKIPAPGVRLRGVAKPSSGTCVNGDNVCRCPQSFLSPSHLQPDNRSPTEIATEIGQPCLLVQLYKLLLIPCVSVCNNPTFIAQLYLINILSVQDVVASPQRAQSPLRLSRFYS